MKSPVNREQAIGKTIAKIDKGSGPACVITFMDDTFAVIEASLDYDQEAECNWLLVQAALRWVSNWTYDAKKFGIISEEEREDIHSLDRKDREDVERRQYERLKAKFECHGDK